MKIWISYFYQVRNFTPNMIPFSTATFDPKWYHQNEGLGKVFIDKNGVVNGLRLPQLSFPKEAYEYLLEIDSACSDNCPLKNKVVYQMKQNEFKDDWQTFGCRFMDAYFKHLWENVDFDKLMDYFKKTVENYSKHLKTDDPVEIVLLVHEAPSNPCAERPVLIQWFKEFGYDLEEWNPYE